MLLIFGFKVRFKTLASIFFHCPTCGGDRQGSHQVARRWFTLFWIPVIPLNQVGEVVTCDTCGSRYDPGVTELPTTAAIGESFGVATRVVASMLVRTGEAADPALRQQALGTIRTVIDPYDEQTFANDVVSVDPAYAEQYTAPLADSIAVEGKERLLADLTRVALAGGIITDDQRRVLDLAGRGLGLTPAHISGVVSSVTRATSPDVDPDPTDPISDH